MISGHHVAEWLDLDRVVPIDALPRDLRQRLAETALRAGAVDAALELATLDEQDPPVWLFDVRAEALLTLGRAIDAIPIIEERMARAPAVAPQKLLALARLATGDEEAALQTARRMVQDHPESITAWVGAGEIALHVGNLAGARRSFERAAGLGGRGVSAVCGLARTMIREGEPAAALALLTPHLAEPAVSVHLALIEAAEAAGNTMMAERSRLTLRERAEQSRLMWRERLLSLDPTVPLPARKSRRQPAPSTSSTTFESEEEPAPPLVSLSQPDEPSPELVSALREYFGYESFRPGQAAVCRAILAGRNTLAIMPTGAGKSLCFQLPSMLIEGVTVVISPLVALMKDQIDGLPPLIYPRAMLLNSTLTSAELDRRQARLAGGELKLVYVAPERLRQPAFVQSLQRARVSRVVVDEAHCVSSWGHDFRPDYLAIGSVLSRIANPPVLALTATAPALIQADISRQLGRTFAVLQTPLFRPNLRFEVRQAKNATEKLARLIEFCQAESGSGVIYVNSRDRTENIAAALRAAGILAAHYHAGMEAAERSRAQDDFMLDRTRIIVATVAFGMGVDKTNIRFVVHFSLPESLEAYVQEAGRAGRDGQPARCVLFYSSSDKSNLTNWLNRSRVDLDDLRAVYRRLRIQIGNAPAGPVDERALLGGDPENSGIRARVCVSLLERAELLRRDPDDPRLLKLLPPPAEAGPRLEKLLALFAAYQDRRIEEVVQYARSPTCRHERIARHFNQIVEPPCGACDICQPLDAMVPPPLSRRGRFPERTSGSLAINAPDSLDEFDQAARDRFERLRAWRRKTADAASIPPYIVFGDATLRALAAILPARLSLQTLARVKGIGPKKLAQYGEELLVLLR